METGGSLGSLWEGSQGKFCVQEQSLSGAQVGGLCVPSPGEED